MSNDAQRLLHYGDRGADVTIWQALLASRGLSVSDSSGHFGPSTANATRALQRSLGVTQDGIVGPQTRAALDTILPSLSYAPESFDLDSIPFIEARHYDKHAKPRRAVDLIVIHTMETPYDINRAETSSTRFASLKAPMASYHYGIDSDSIVQTVEEDRVAWHAPGVNGVSIGIEHAGYARQTPDEWADAFSTSMLTLSARLAARICTRWNIPPTPVDSSGLLIHQRGITTHAAVSMAFKKSNHTDPGHAFPLGAYCADVVHYKKELQL